MAFGGMEKKRLASLTESWASQVKMCFERIVVNPPRARMFSVVGLFLKSQGVALRKLFMRGTSLDYRT
jgi:hypothetical protein